MLLPRPSSVSGSPRDRANRTSAAQLEGVVRGGEQVGRATDPHRRQLRERRVPLGLHADPAGDLAGERARSRSTRGRRRRSRGHGAASGGVIGGRVMRRPARCAATASRRAAAGARRGRAAARATASAAPGSAERRAAAAMVACAGRVVEDRHRLEQRRGVERLVRDEARRAGVDQLGGVRALVGAGVGYGTTTIGRPNARRLGERRRAGPADDQVGRRERVEQLLAEERGRPVALADCSPAGSARRGSAPRRSRRRR